MFSKNKKTGPKSHLASLSIISTDLHITGNIETGGDLQIEGRVVGNIQAYSLVVGDQAYIQGAVTCHDVQVRGCVEGSIQAHNVILTKQAKVIGDIQHETLSIEVGAFLDGRCEHIVFSKGETETGLLEGPIVSEDTNVSVSK